MGAFDHAKYFDQKGVRRERKQVIKQFMTAYIHHLIITPITWVAIQIYYSLWAKRRSDRIIRDFKKPRRKPQQNRRLKI